MNMEDLLQLGAKIFSNSNLSGDAGSNLDSGALSDALAGLTSGEGGLDLGALLGKLDSGGLGDIAKSWLGDGENSPISPEQINNTIGPENLTEFASKLGLSLDEAAGGLSDALPQMMDNASSGGSLLESIGGIEGAIGIAKKLFGN